MLSVDGEAIDKIPYSFINIIGVLSVYLNPSKQRITRNI
jgi:hypothetical protein